MTENRNKWILVGQESWKVTQSICLQYKVFVTIPSLHFDPQLLYKLFSLMKKPLAFKDIIHQIYGKYEIYGQGMHTENLSLFSN